MTPSTLLGLDHGQPPVITSPLPGRTYQLSDDVTAELPLKARATPGVRQLYWFSGDAFLGSCPPPPPSPGTPPPATIPSAS